MGVGELLVLRPLRPAGRIVEVESKVRRLTKKLVEVIVSVGFRGHICRGATIDLVCQAALPPVVVIGVGHVADLGSGVPNRVAIEELARAGVIIPMRQAQQPRLRVVAELTDELERRLVGVTVIAYILSPKLAPNTYCGAKYQHPLVINDGDTETKNLVG